MVRKEHVKQCNTVVQLIGFAKNKKYKFKAKLIEHFPNFFFINLLNFLVCNEHPTGVVLFCIWPKLYFRSFLIMAS